MFSITSSSGDHIFFQNEDIFVQSYELDEFN